MHVIGYRLEQWDESINLIQPVLLTRVPLEQKVTSLTARH